jgi:hypothetical protein
MPYLFLLLFYNSMFWKEGYKDKLGTEERKKEGKG